MRRWIWKSFLVATVLWVGGTTLTAAGETQIFVHPIDLGDRCGARFEEFVDRGGYYAVFAVSVEWPSLACASGADAPTAIARCEELAQRKLGKCKVYAASPVDGKVKMVWKVRKEIVKPPKLQQPVKGWSLLACPGEFQRETWNNCVGTRSYGAGNKYVGEWRLGKAHGQGAWYYADGDTYIGGWKDGLRHGKGSLIHANGRVLGGEWAKNLRLPAGVRLEQERPIEGRRIARSTRANLNPGIGPAVSLMSKPSSGAERVAWIGGSVAVLGYADGGKWVRVKSGGQTGYVRRSDLHANSLAAVSSGVTASRRTVSGKGDHRVNLNPSVGPAVSLRSKPSSGAGRVAWIGGSVAVLEYADGGKWVRVKSGGQTGYVRRSDLHANSLEALGALRPGSQKYLQGHLPAGEADRKRKDLLARGEADRAHHSAIEAKQQKRQRIILMQTALRTLGLYDGSVDGVMGPKTRAAINRWLKVNGMAAGTELSDDLVVGVKAQADVQIARNLAEAKTKEQRRRANQDKALVALRKAHKHSIAVIIGNQDYTGRTPDVAYAGNDADAVRRFVTADLGYRDGNIIDLRDASLTQLNATFGTAGNHRGRLFDYVRAGKSDVIVFYSGHGVPGLRDRKGYLLPVNADPNRAELNGYPLDTLLANLAKVPARSMAVYIDACFSGESQKGLLVRATSGITVQAKVPQSSKRMIVVTAAQGDQFASWDEDAKHGLFTKHLLEALRGEADGEGYGNGDGKVTLAELRAYLDEEMTYQARRRWSRDQNASVQGASGSVLATLH
jgi:peptidoglycan hydrolase-like protein with peptidoglycan-binding domain